jgi:hypothetical protein
MSYPKNGTLVDAIVVAWFLAPNTKHCLIAKDSEGRSYIHWLDDDIRWSSEPEWTKNIGKTGLRLKLRCGRKSGPRGLISFVYDLLDDVVVQKAQQPTIPFDASNDVPRSPYDVVSKQLDETLSSLVESKPEAKPPAKPIRPMCHVSIEEASTQLQFVSHELGKPMTFVANKCLEHGIKPMVFLACGGKV